jgi:plasmid stability protein
MPSITIKDLPENLLERLRRRAREDKRSMNREVIHLLDLALARETVQTAKEARSREVDRQVQVWRSLAGRWDSDLDTAEEIAGIYAARTPGRDVDL